MQEWSAVVGWRVNSPQWGNSPAPWIPPLREQSRLREHLVAFTCDMFLIFVWAHLINLGRRCQWGRIPLFLDPNSTKRSAERAPAGCKYPYSLNHENCFFSFFWKTYFMGKKLPLATCLSFLSRNGYTPSTEIISCSRLTVLRICNSVKYSTLM